MKKSSDLNSRPFKIGDWLIMPEINRIIGTTGKHNIGSRTMQVLVSLAQSQGQVVTKETLMETVWRDVVVTEDSLMKSISVLRKIFEEAGENKPKIDTIRSVGYVLLSPIKYAEGHRLVEGLRKDKPRLITYSLVLVPLAVIALSFFFFDSSKNVPVNKVIQITDDWGQERVPRFSPDGKKVMFARATGGNNNLDIYIKDLKTQDLNHLENPHNLETDPVWSPSGDEIAFFRNDGKSVWIIVKNVKNDQETEVITVNSIVNLSAMIWTPDGESIIYCDRLEGQRAFALHRVDLDSKNITQLTKPEGRIVGDSSPRISPNGRSLAFIRSYRYSNLYYHLIPGYGRLMTMALNNGEETEVTKTPEQITGVSWADNEHLLYSFVNKNYTFQIAKTNLATDDTIIVHETSEIIRNLDFHAKTNQLVFETWNESYNIWKFSDLPQSTNFSSKYIKGGNTSWNPTYHHKTNQLAYVSRESGYAEIWIENLETKSRTKMTNFNGAIVRYPQWSPNGKQISFEVNKERNNDVFMLDIASKQSNRIIDDLGHEKFPCWSLDGSALYYGSNKTGAFQIHKKSLTDSTDIQITTNGGIRAIPYGKDIYYCFPYSRGIWKLESGEEKKVIENFIPNDIANWQIVKNKLFYISRSRYGKPELYYMDPTDGSQHHYQSFSYPMSYTFSGFTYDVRDSSWLITLNDVIRSDIKMIVVEANHPRNENSPATSKYAFFK
ncbi:MAG: winged helix-turn-helix domain-containing protein [Reichenbachiella sp.]|uniref:winged helix-turn-helix domain-containing protein n=1 Tax=Reichenbachiella sp. TaxID=2184521 RepID=UPI0032649238